MFCEAEIRTPHPYTCKPPARLDVTRVIICGIVATAMVRPGLHSGSTRLANETQNNISCHRCVLSFIHPAYNGDSARCELRVLLIRWLHCCFFSLWSRLKCRKAGTVCNHYTKGMCLYTATDRMYTETRMPFALFTSTANFSGPLPFAPSSAR